MEEHEFKFVLFMGFLYIQLVTVKAETYDDAEYKLWDYLSEENISPLAIQLLYEEEITYV